MSNLIIRLNKIEELQKRKYPEEYAAHQKAFSAWWEEKKGKYEELKANPDSLYTPIYKTLTQTFERLWSLTKADDEYKAIQEQFPNTED